MAYIKTNWVNNVTKLNADNMNHLEDGVESVSTLASNTATAVSNLAAVATSGLYSDLIGRPAEITETTISLWGFTKNTGTITSISFNDSTISSGAVSLGNIQAALISGTNIKTINGSSILGSGNISISGYTSPTTTRGDMIVRGASYDIRVGIGTAGQVLKVNSSANGVEWANESSGATYSAGTGIDISNNTISVDTSTIATKSDLSTKQDSLTAGSNITITDNTISAINTTYENKQAVQSGTDVSLVTTGEKYIWNNKSDFDGSYTSLTNKPTIPTALSQLSDDSTHRLVSDTDISIWNNKQNELTTSSVNTGTLSKYIGFDTQGRIVKNELTVNSVKLYRHTLSIWASDDSYTGPTSSEWQPGDLGFIVEYLSSSSTPLTISTVPDSLIFSGTYNQGADGIMTGCFVEQGQNRYFKFFVNVYRDSKDVVVPATISYSNLIDTDKVIFTDTVSAMTLSTDGTSVKSSNINSENSTNGQVLTSNGSGSASWQNPAVPSQMSYLTTAPTSANTSGNLIFVVLSSEPATYYDGYYYIITE